MENIEVALRIRPPNQSELERDDPEIWQTIPPNAVSLISERTLDLLKFRKINPGQKTNYAFSKRINEELRCELILCLL
jgi:hypothetical protein